MKSSVALLSAALLPIGLLGATHSAHAVDLVGFNVPSTYSILGSVNTLTVPTALTVLLDGPVFGDTFITIDSSDESRVMLPGGGVTVSAGFSSAQVLLSGLSLGDAVLTAHFNGKDATATVSVVTSIPSVPEPASLGLWALGLAVTAALAGRKGKA